MQAALATALAAAAGCGLYFAYRRARQCKLRLTYFDVRAAPGEKLRLALALAGVPFEDHRIASKEWEELKPTTKYGQLPILEIDGVSYYQSGALLRWIGSTLGDGSLYPSSAAARMKVEEMMGLADDIAKAWAPALYIGMKPQAFQYTKENAPVREMREHFMAEEFPKYMGMVENELKQTGAFICGVRRSPEPDTPSRLLCASTTHRPLTFLCILALRQSQHWQTVFCIRNSFTSGVAWRITSQRIVLSHTR